MLFASDSENQNFIKIMIGYWILFVGISNNKTSITMKIKDGKTLKRIMDEDEIIKALETMNLTSSSNIIELR